MDSQKVTVLKDCAIGGKHTPKGAVVMLSGEDAKELIGMGRAEPAPIDAPTAENPEQVEPAPVAGKAKGK